VTLRQRIYAARAAAAGLTVEEWHARNEAAQAELDHYYALRNSHTTQIAVIAAHAARHSRQFTHHQIGA
jgi:hypothetical protein